MMKNVSLIILVIGFSSIQSFGQVKRSSVENWKTEADTLMSQQNYEAALKLYDKIVKKTRLRKDDDFKVLYSRAFALYNLGESDRALRDLDQYLQRFNDLQALLLRCYVNESLERNADLLHDLDTIIAQYPDPELIKWRASVLFDEGQYGEAQRDLRMLIEHTPDAHLELFFGLTYYYQGNVDSAYFIFDNIIANYPAVLEAYSYAASVALESEDYDTALRYVEKGLLQAPDNAELIFSKGIALLEKDNQAEGCRLLRKIFYQGYDDAADYLKEYCFGIEH